MTSKVERALQRLISVLPLKERQEACGPEVKHLHQQVLRSFVDKGRILTLPEMAKHVRDLESATEILQRNDMVVFAENGEPVGAYPFTIQVREHRIQMNGHEVHAMCALDALAVSPMFGLETRISSVCRVTGAQIVIRQSGNTILNEEEIGQVCFGIAWGAASACSCCADTLCMEMMFLKDGSVAQQWLEQDPENREIFTLAEAVEFGARFFIPLMD